MERRELRNGHEFKQYLIITENNGNKYKFKEISER